MSVAHLQVDGVEVSPQHYIDGTRVASPCSFEVFSPIQQQRLGEVYEADNEQITVSDPLTRVLSTADISDEVFGFDVPGH